MLGCGVTELDWWIRGRRAGCPALPVKPQVPNCCELALLLAVDCSSFSAAGAVAFPIRPCQVPKEGGVRGCLRDRCRGSCMIQTRLILAASRLQVHRVLWSAWQSRARSDALAREHTVEAQANLHPVPLLRRSGKQGSPRQSSATSRSECFENAHALAIGKMTAPRSVINKAPERRLDRELRHSGGTVPSSQGTGERPLEADGIQLC
ncbi:hypothetical protein QBC47DRAFT_394905 [Echria macrotheca]|uniref:Uncharacterized protein n=1 Tax=Echria macrotheca TaxID=438768 RepID=A0AAJ0F434_9PEZI|nr:hypothetical protein QBC47DRAFT_394905 [Echria macrotheca]